MNPFFPAKSGSNKPSSAGRPDSSSKGKRPGTSRFAASKRSAWKIGVKCIYKNKYTVKISRINADKTFNISYQEGRYKGKVMEGVEKEDLELDDGDRLDRSNKDVVLVGDSQMPNPSSKIRIDDRVEAKRIDGWNKYYKAK